MLALHVQPDALHRRALTAVGRGSRPPRGGPARAGSRCRPSARSRFCGAPAALRSFSRAALPGTWVSRGEPVFASAAAAVGEGRTRRAAAPRPRKVPCTAGLVPSGAGAALWRRAGAGGTRAPPCPVRRATRGPSERPLPGHEGHSEGHSEGPRRRRAVGAAGQTCFVPTRGRSCQTLPFAVLVASAALCRAFEAPWAESPAGAC